MSDRISAPYSPAPTVVKGKHGHNHSYVFRSPPEVTFSAMTDVAAQLRALADQVDDLTPADLVGALVALTFTIWTGATTPTPPPPNSRGLTVDAVCARTSMSKRWVYQEARKGRLPFAHRLGRRLVFDEQGLERWLARRR